MVNSYLGSSIHLCRLPWWLSRKKSVCQCRRCGFDPWVGKMAWRRKWQPAPVFFLGNPMDRGAWGATGVGNNLATKEQHHFTFVTKNHHCFNDATLCRYYYLLGRQPLLNFICTVFISIVIYSHQFICFLQIIAQNEIQLFKIILSIH